MIKPKAIGRIFTMIVFFVFLDQFTKSTALTFFDTPFYLIEDSVGFILRKNSGIAFSIPLSGEIITLITPLLTALFILFSLKYFNFSYIVSQLTFCLFFSGLIGNFIDRLAYEGQVVDFIALGWYPVFNLADVFLTAGVIAMIVFKNKVFIS